MNTLNSQNQSSSHPFIPNTPEERAEMLAAINAASFSDLVQDIPDTHRFPDLKLPNGLSELTVSERLNSLAASNIDLSTCTSFLGAGAYNHFIPSTVNAVLQRGEFVTSYTPYQPEASQGTLQAGFEFQSAICQLFQMDVANAGMYDGPTAFAEACLMAARVTRRSKIIIIDSADPRLIDVLYAYTKHQDVQVQLLDSDDAVSGAIDQDTACIAFQSPNFIGAIEDVCALTQLARDAGALSVMHTNPISSAFFISPGALGVDIVSAEGQPLGVSLTFGGAYVGLLATRKSYLRQMPGRIIGKTSDTQGRDGYTLTLQTREQHIRRERATSNICTSTQLIALMVAVYVATMGPQGIRKAAELCYHKAHYMAQQINKLPNWNLAPGFSNEDEEHKKIFFNEFPIVCPIPPAEVNRKLLQHSIVGGLDISNIIPNAMLICATEMNSKEEIDRFVQTLNNL